MKLNLLVMQFKVPEDLKNTRTKPLDFHYNLFHTFTMLKSAHLNIAPCAWWARYGTSLELLTDFCLPPLDGQG